MYSVSNFGLLNSHKHLIYKCPFASFQIFEILQVYHKSEQPLSVIKFKISIMEMWACNRGLGIHMANSVPPLVKAQDWSFLSELYLYGNRSLVWWRSSRSSESGSLKFLQHLHPDHSSYSKHHRSLSCLSAPFPQAWRRNRFLNLIVLTLLVLYCRKETE